MFLRLFFGKLSLFVWFVVVYSKIVLYVLFVICFTIKEVRICVAYYDFFNALTQIFRATCNTDVVGDSRCFSSTSESHEPMVVIPIRLPLTLVPTSHPRPILSVWSACTIQQVSSQFLPLYQPAHRKSIYKSKPEQTNMIKNIL